jgi:hypothetical protein
LHQCQEGYGIGALFRKWVNLIQRESANENESQMESGLDGDAGRVLAQAPVVEVDRRRFAGGVWTTFMRALSWTAFI